MVKVPVAACDLLMIIVSPQSKLIGTLAIGVLPVLISLLCNSMHLNLAKPSFREGRLPASITPPFGLDSWNGIDSRCPPVSLFEVLLLQLFGQMTDRAHCQQISWRQ